MSNLKKKILIILISILSIFLIILISLYNISIYNKEKNDINQTFRLLETTRQQININEYNPAIMDNEAYEIIINRNGNIEKIIGFSPKAINTKKITKIIKKNINVINSRKTGNIFMNDYLFGYTIEGHIIMLNNNSTRSYLVMELVKSLIVFIILETGIIFLSIKITKWIVKPVDEAFIKQKQFIYDASHELKTPIAIISASVETLEKSPKEKKWLNNIKSENERMEKLVTNLLELSKSENIKETEVFTKTDISKIIQNKALSFESLMYESKLELKLDIQKDINYVCNPDRIKELSSILIDNAIKHGEKKTEIEVKLLKEKNNIILSVKNKGQEIPKEEREKIFERFYRVDKSRNRDENRYGLGLSIAKNIVINHGGTIKVNCENGYTTFIVILKQN